MPDPRRHPEQAAVFHPVKMRTDLDLALTLDHFQHLKRARVIMTLAEDRIGQDIMRGFLDHPFDRPKSGSDGLRDSFRRRSFYVEIGLLGMVENRFYGNLEWVNPRCAYGRSSRFARARKFSLHQVRIL